ncbi:MAG: hypothetical protein PHC51_10100 [bacterium]|nr:hypothetical protein [bacterium]
MRSIFLSVITTLLFAGNVIACPTRSISLQGTLDLNAASTNLPSQLTFANLSSAATYEHTVDVRLKNNSQRQLSFYWFTDGASEWSLYIYVDGGDVGGAPGIPVQTAHIANVTFQSGHLSTAKSVQLTIPWTSSDLEPITVSLNEISLNAAGHNEMFVSQDGTDSGCSALSRNDYDGDGVGDRAIWRPDSGYWAVVNSSYHSVLGTHVSPYIWQQWGLPGDYPMQGDYTGDGKSDLVVWRPGNGTWYICSSEVNFDCSQGIAIQWGLPGDRPLTGDYNADGVNDPVIWRPSDNRFYIYNENSGYHGTQWGLPGDIPIGVSSAQ